MSYLNLFQVELLMQIFFLRINIYLRAVELLFFIYWLGLPDKANGFFFSFFIFFFQIEYLQEYFFDKVFELFQGGYELLIWYFANLAF